MPATVEQLVGVARRHQVQLLATRDRTRSALEALWGRLVTDPSDTAAGRWLTSAVPLLAAGESATANAALAYVRLYVEAAGVRPKPQQFTAGDFLRPRGVDLDELLMRPVIDVRSRLAGGARLPEALQAGRVRAAQIGATDPMLAARAASSEAMKAEPSIVGYRRVPDGKACPFCLLAATQRYRDSDLMAMHPNCGCTVAPIVGTMDPGRVLDRDTLERLRSEGVLDDINRRRHAQADRDSGRRAEEQRARANYWRQQAAAADDPATRRRYEARAAEWDRKANITAGDIPAPDLITASNFNDSIFAEARSLAAVRNHGELGPTLYQSGHNFDAG